MTAAEQPDAMPQVLASPGLTSFAVDRCQTAAPPDVPRWETFDAAPVAWLSDADVLHWTPLEPVAEGLNDRVDAAVMLIESRGKRVLGDEQCCELACDGGGCETCPCCSAGWCVNGLGVMPDDGEDWASWLEVARQHNPIAKALWHGPSDPDGAPVLGHDEAETLLSAVQSHGRMDEAVRQAASALLLAAGLFTEGAAGEPLRLAADELAEIWSGYLAADDPGQAGEATSQDRINWDAGRKRWGACTACGGVKRLRRDGAVWNHGDATDRLMNCRGGGLAPKPGTVREVEPAAEAGPVACRGCGVKPGAMHWGYCTQRCQNPDCSGAPDGPGACKCGAS